MPPAFDSNKDLDSRDTYLSSLVHCLDWNPALRVDPVPGPLVILQDLYRIIASEWIAVNAYVERDLNTIEYRLEHEKGHLDSFESFLKRLFIMRRRTQKFENLVNEQLQLFDGHIPDYWLHSSSASSTAIKNDLEQVQELIHRNADRITQSVSLIMSLMAVHEGKTSNAQNRGLGFLTVLATLALPFNTIATILGMQTEYRPGQPKFKVFKDSASGSAAGLLLLYFLYITYLGWKSKLLRT